jgi:hypothetical protein
LPTTSKANKAQEPFISGWPVFRPTIPSEQRFTSVFFATSALVQELVFLSLLSDKGERRIQPFNTWLQKALNAEYCDAR